MAQQDLNAVGLRILDASRAALMIELPYLDVLLCALQSRNGEDVTSSIATDGQYLFYTGSIIIISAGRISASRSFSALTSSALVE